MRRRGVNIIPKSVLAEGFAWKTKFWSGQLGKDLCTLLIYELIIFGWAFEIRGSVYPAYLQVSHSFLLNTFSFCQNVMLCFYLAFLVLFFTFILGFITSFRFHTHYQLYSVLVVSSTCSLLLFEKQSGIFKEITNLPLADVFKN